MNNVESLSAEVKEVLESKNKTGFNYKLGDRWFFSMKGIQKANVGDEVLVEFECTQKDGREANFIRSLKLLKEATPPQALQSDLDVLGSILRELKDIKDLMREKRVY
jgi:hypothetical protein